MYTSRVLAVGGRLRSRFPTGNVAVFTHATTSFSIAYALCFGQHGGSDQTLEHFVVGQQAIGPAGVIAVVLDARTGSCKHLAQTLNSPGDPAQCGKTEPYKCNFGDFPSWYWRASEGRGPGRCS